MRAAVVVFCALLLGACSPNAPPAARPLPTPSFVNGGPCPRAENRSLPSDAGCVTSLRPDLDGDGRSDEVMVFARVDSAREPNEWELRWTAEESSGRTALDYGNAFTYPRATGVSDVDGDGRDEVFVKLYDQLYHSGATRVLGLLTFASGRLSLVSDEGEPLLIKVGGISRFGEGAECGDGTITQLRAEARNVANTRWKTSERLYRLSGPVATLKGQSEGVLRIEDYNDPDLDPYFELRCGDLVVE